MFIFPTLLANLKDLKESLDMVTALWAELLIAHAPLLFYFHIPTISQLILIFRTSIPENRDSIDLMASMGFQSKEAVPSKEQFEEAKFGVRIKALNKVL